MSQRNPGQAPVSSMAPECRWRSGRIGAELRFKRNAEGEQRRGAGAVPVGDEAAGVGAGGGDRLCEFLRLQSGQIALQHNDIRRRLANDRLRGGDRVVQRIAMTVRGRVGEYLRAQLAARYRQQPDRG